MRIRAVCIIILMVITLGGCKVTEEGLKTIQFADRLSVQVLKKYDGKPVAINGFLSPISEYNVDQQTDSTVVNNEVAYLVTQPYSSHVACEDNEVHLTDFIALHLQEGQMQGFTPLPVTVSGTLVFQEVTDENDLSYSYYIKDAVITEYEESQDDRIIVYSNLVKDDFVQLFDSYMSTVYNTINSEDEIQNLEVIDESLFGSLYTIFDAYEGESYEEIKNLVSDAMLLVKDINSAIVEEDNEEFDNLNTQGQKIYTEFYEWLNFVTF